MVVSTVVRDAPLSQHGFVYIVDCEEKEVVRRFQPPLPRLRELGPRGGSRGYRGITFLGDLCYIANHDSLFAYDTHWELVDSISHPLFTGIHEIESDGEGIWVTSTGTDAVLKVSQSGEIMEQHFLGELPSDVRAMLGIQARRVDHGADHRNAQPDTSTHVAHPNGLSIVEGRPYVTLYRPGAVIALNPFELIWRDDSSYGVHSGRLLEGGVLLYMASSFRSEFRGGGGVDLESGRETLQVNVLGDGRYKRSWRSRIQGLLHHPMFGSVPTVFILKHAPPVLRGFLPSSRPGWSRGIAVIDEDDILGGSSSATIFLINTRKSCIEGQLQLGDSIQHSVFSIAIDPRDRSNG